ncbi:hypothetical protein [Methylosinus sp. LW3]|uniref:hypothetical protein n=1 Tax=Methylosinus sp. LW3 TaxID=107635 RepID=UPI00046547C4|nr:hypothetical protein [Methylosinus sp. LW3]
MSNQRRRLLRDVRALRNEVAEIGAQRDLQAEVSRLRARMARTIGADEEARRWQDPAWQAKAFGQAEWNIENRAARTA